jgi:hypothetical protein
MQAFFRRSREGQTLGYPRFQGANRYNSFTYKQFGNGATLVDHSPKGDSWADDCRTRARAYARGRTPACRGPTPPPHACSSAGPTVGAPENTERGRPFIPGTEVRGLLAALRQWVLGSLQDWQDCRALVLPAGGHAQESPPRLKHYGRRVERVLAHRRSQRSIRWATSRSRAAGLHEPEVLLLWGCGPQGLVRPLALVPGVWHEPASGPQRCEKHRAARSAPSGSRGVGAAQNRESPGFCRGNVN